MNCWILLLGVTVIQQPQVVIDGEKYSDVRQGRLGTCTVLAALAAGANSRSVHFATRIRKIGPSKFNVKYFKGSSGRQSSLSLEVSSGRTEDDPRFAALGTEEWWPILMQRVYLHSMRSSDRTLENGSNALAFVTGNRVDMLVQKMGLRGKSIRDAVLTRLKKGHCVILQTKSDRAGTDGFERILLSHHGYAVIGATDQYMELYNPHGVDIRKGSSAVRRGQFRGGISDRIDDNPFDGLIRIPWTAVESNIKEIYASPPRS